MKGSTKTFVKSKTMRENEDLTAESWMKDLSAAAMPSAACMVMTYILDTPYLNMLPPIQYSIDWTGAYNSITNKISSALDSSYVSISSICSM